MADRSTVKMAGKLDFSSVKICSSPVANTHIRTVEQVRRICLETSLLYLISVLRFKRSRD